MGCLYRPDFDKTEGILVEYDLFPHEVLMWDNRKKVLKVRLRYTPLLKFKKALQELGIMYDEEYWRGRNMSEILKRKSIGMVE